MSVVATGIGVALGNSQVLEDVLLNAQAGQVTAIVGPNGSGKTTLLRTLTGDVPYDGGVAINGQDITQLPSWQLATLRAVLPQATNLAFPFTVIEVVRIGLHNSRDGSAGGIAVQALARVGLGGYENRFYQELSGGEQQRVQLARVLAQVWQPFQNGVPRWLFLDEPVSSLDIGHQLQVMDIMRQFAAAGGGVVAVMHDLNLTALYADQIVMMSGGRVLASGGAHDVMTDDTLTRAYQCRIKVSVPPVDGTPFVLPTVRHQAEA